MVLLKRQQEKINAIWIRALGDTVSAIASGAPTPARMDELAFENWEKAFAAICGEIFDKFYPEAWQKSDREGKIACAECILPGIRFDVFRAGAATAYEEFVLTTAAASKKGSA